MPLPSLGGFHRSSPHNVTTDNVQRERSTYLEKREIKDASFLTHHFHISQTSIGLWRVDSHSGRDEGENLLFVMSMGWKYPDCSHGRDGERGCSCFLERAGAWVDPPRRALLCRVPYTTGSAPFCFLAPVHVTVEHSQSIHVLAFVCSIMVKIECVSFCCGKAMKILVPLVSGIFSVISLVSDF